MESILLEWRKFVERLGTHWEAVRRVHCSNTMWEEVLGSEWSCQPWLDLVIVPEKLVLAPSKR